MIKLQDQDNMIYDENKNLILKHKDKLVIELHDKNNVII